MTGFDIQRYEYCKEKAHSMSMDVLALDNRIEIYRIENNKLKKRYCSVETVEEAYQFLCGYDWGRHEDYE